ncbi:unnamed protein product [Discula destructiva]
MPSITLEYPTEPYSTVKRFPARGTHELETIHTILNNSPILHVSFTVPSSPFPMLLPMIGFTGSYNRPSADLGDVLDLYLHGYISARLMRLARNASGDDEDDSTTTTTTISTSSSSSSSTSAKASRHTDQGLPISVAASTLDGIVLTSTPNGHVYNYRSAVVFGHASLVTSNAEKLWAMQRTVDAVIPDRWANTVLPLAPAELASTSVLRVKIKTGSAKIRTGPPSAETGDGDAAVWRGVLPVWTAVGEPIATPERVGMEVPAHLEDFGRRMNEKGREYAVEAAGQVAEVKKPSRED